MRDASKDRRWAIVLSGGQGERMRPFIQRWLGEPRPKQYCAFVGKRTMLEHAVDRARRVAGKQHIITLIGRGHQAYLERSAIRNHGKLIEQPLDMGTAAGVFLPLAYIMDEDPDATVVLLPSDHYIHPEHKFVALLRRACQFAEAEADRMILVGATPTRSETEYGWIAVGDRADTPIPRNPRVLDVKEFCEKPGRAEAERLHRGGGLWNTMVMTAKARTLWDLGVELLPEVLEPLDAFRFAMHAHGGAPVHPMHELVALYHAYTQLKPRDFSRDFVQRAAARALAIPMTGIAWCDWGRPMRVIETLAAIGARPAFPVEMAEETASGSLIPAPTPPHAYVS